MSQNPNTAPNKRFYITDDDVKIVKPKKKKKALKNKEK